MALLSTKQAAEKLGISAIRVRQLIAESKIVAQQVGRDWVIEDSALNSVIVYGKAGRPPKAKTPEPVIEKKAPNVKKGTRK